MVGNGTQVEMHRSDAELLPRVYDPDSWFGWKVVIGIQYFWDESGLVLGWSQVVNLTRVIDDRTKMRETE